MQVSEARPGNNWYTKVVQRRDRIEVVAIDPSAAFVILEMLSRTTVSVDGCHLAMKANDEI